MLAAGATAISLGAWAAGVGLLGVSALFLLGGSLLRASGSAVPLLNDAYAAAQHGRIAEAERLLDRVEAGRPIRYVRRVADLQRANLALRRGDLDGAATRLDGTLARPTGFFTGRDERVHVLGAHAARALVLASKGEVARARIDIAAVRGSPLATVDVLARAEVAEAILLERGGDRDALATHLGRARRLLLDYTAPRERAIVRAYQRMLEAPRASVYRQAARRDTEVRDEPPLADWIARIAPAAAPFVRVARVAEGGASPAEEARVEPGLVKLAEQRVAGQGASRASRKASKVLAIWVLLIGVFTAIWQLLTVPGAPVEGAATRAAPDAAAIITPLVALFVVLFVVLIRRNLGVADRLAAALGVLARGDEAAAIRELTALAAGKATLVSAQAHLHLARIASRHADFDEAIRRCDEGIGRLGAQPATREIASPILLPDLVSERAYALAATGRHDKARAEMEVVRTSFPSYPFRASAEVRVSLMERVRRGDLEGAARVADGKSEDVPLPLRDEILADLARATARPQAGNELEKARIARELRSDAELRAFVEAVAPDLLTSFARGGDATSDAETSDPETSDSETSDRDHEAEREAEAEHEALADHEPPIARAG